VQMSASDRMPISACLPKTRDSKRESRSLSGSRTPAERNQRCCLPGAMIRCSLPCRYAPEGGVALHSTHAGSMGGILALKKTSAMQHHPSPLPGREVQCPVSRTVPPGRGGCPCLRCRTRTGDRIENGIAFGKLPAVGS
jgi:hypothetical protein